ncbi:MAG: sigma-70 family RNA polymerase sigma factor [Armatimonadetes bacterium]|nr:sigma-70 family RNA polymerase sigma factor [Armatimonadota bacterium]
MKFKAQQDSKRNERFDALAERSHRKVYNLAYRLSMNKQDAEDLTQEAFYRAYRNFNDFEGDRPFENWIFRIVTRLFLDLNRARKRRVQTVSYDAPKRPDGSDDLLLVEAADQSPTAEQILVNETMSEELEMALNTLKPEQRMLVILADVEQMPYNEIAQVAGVPVGTVRSRLHRAHRKLKEMLERTRVNPAFA